ncbi:MAG: hypothetical protein ABUS51_04580 [Acidobacteriota bacterium]
MKPLDIAEVECAEAKTIAARQQKIMGAEGQPLLGVAFSGGGIRSATFNLGIVQGMTKSGLLPRIDYLSTVSGGGYVGTWLHGVIRRFGGGDPQSAALASLLTRPESSPHGSPAEDPVEFLRKYSSYLAPDVGLFSADFWVIAGIWVRNMMLNQLIILPFFAAIALLVFFFGSLSGWHVDNGPHLPVDLAVAAASMFGLVWCAGHGVGSVALDGFRKGRAGAPGDGATHSKWDSTGNATVCSALMLLAAISLALASDSLSDHGWMTGPPRVALALGAAISVMFAILQWQGKFAVCFAKRHGHPPRFGTWAYPLLAGLPTGFLFFAVMKMLVGLDVGMGVWHTVAWGPPLLSFSMLFGASLHIGLLGVDYDDNAREWLARLGANSMLLSFAWTALFAISVFGPYWISQIAMTSWAPAAGLGGWVITSLAGAVTGSSSRTPAKADEKTGPGVMGVIAAVAPTVFIFGYLLLISFGVHMTIAELCGLRVSPAAIVSDAGRAPRWVLAIAATEQKLKGNSDFNQEALVALALLLGAGVMIWYLPRRIDINEFSMHHFYKNRLVRCYLGATKGKSRRPSRLTGFDPADDIPLADLVPEKNYFGPYPLINTCINLNRGSELAKMERRGSAFLFSPVCSGYDPPRSDTDRKAVTRSRWWNSGTLHPNGYRPTRGYGYPAGFMIGTCMGISGAAANPNGGYHTSGPMAFLMTLFSVRLGWWVGNTRLDGPSSRPGPSHSLTALLAELFAFTDARSDFVNLSDGGHFENLGLYELVRRRCRYIIAGDGEQDGDYHFESLGGAIRKCRTDFGAEIAIDPRRITPKDGASGSHCVVGRITYAGDAEPTGWLLYLKSSLSGDEPEDVAQYKASHADFPQEPTSNQFFTESQFESYRKLGLHVWKSAVAGIEIHPDTGDLDGFFEGLYRRWLSSGEFPQPVAPLVKEATVG